MLIVDATVLVSTQLMTDQLQLGCPNMATYQHQRFSQIPQLCVLVDRTQLFSHTIMIRECLDIFLAIYFVVIPP